MSQHTENCHHRLDRFGALASGLCAVHCAAVPVALSLASGLQLGFLQDERVEWLLISTAALVGLISLASGYRQHRQPAALRTMTAGLSLLVAGRIFHSSSHSFSIGTAASVAGGVTVAAAHLWNVRLAHRHCHQGTPAACPACAAESIAGAKPQEAAEAGTHA
jgi:hypothetical protein